MIVRNNLVFLELDRPTPSSGNIYPIAEVQKALPKFQLLIQQDKAFGGFVDDIDTTTAVIDLNKISHKITEVKIVGNNLIGTIVTLDTVKGQKLETLIDRDDLLFDTRGMGKIKNKMVSEFSILEIDVWFKPGLKRTLADDPISAYDRAMGIIKR